MEKKLLSMDQLTAVLDQAPVAVYVSAVEDFRLIYANRLARELFCRAEDENGKTCYQTVGFKDPCPFCQIDKLGRDDLLVREFSHPGSGRSYQLSGKIIDWSGIPAHIEYVTDITETKEKEAQSKALEQELTEANEKMQDIINAIPGGVAIYKVTDRFETIYFSDGVPELTGYTVEEYREMVKRDAAEMIFHEDKAMVVQNALEVIRTHEVANFEFRKQHRDGHIVWVRIQVKWIGEEDGYPLLHCVFHNISSQKEAKLEMDHLVNSIPGGIASYRVEGNRFIPTYFSDGVMALSGHTREEYEEMIRQDALDIIYEKDRGRVLEVAKTALKSGEVLDVSYRMRHKDGNLIWIHLNGRRMGPLAETMKFYAVFTGMSAETRLFQSIMNETADGIYVISKDNYDLLYVNESKNLFAGGQDCIGKKCYRALQGKNEPCEFCTLKGGQEPGEEQLMDIKGSNRYFSTRYLETDWNGIPAYIKFVRDSTQEVLTRRAKERLEQYFQTVLKYLPGGVAVVHYEKDGSMAPEFLSEGFAALTGMTLKDAWDLYRDDAMAGVHPEDKETVNLRMAEYVSSGESQYELVYRLKKGDGSYVWVKNSLSMIQNEGGESRVYAVYQDMTKELAEQNRIRRQYKEQIMQHYHTQDPNTLILGHCNISQNRILEIMDHTDSGLLKTFGAVREEFFTGIGGLIEDEGERRQFLGKYLNEPSLKAFHRGDFEQQIRCFMKFPKEDNGRYVQIKMNLVATPDSGDVTGILTVTDVTKQVIADRIMNRISVTGYDYVADVDLTGDSYEILSCNENEKNIPPRRGCFSEWVEFMKSSLVVKRDRERYWKYMQPERIEELLNKKGAYTLAFSIMDDSGDIRTKNITVLDADMRIGRICVARTDITESVREQQGLLRVIAYTFELAGFINLRSGDLTLYTRKTVLENLSPFYSENYDKIIGHFVQRFGADENKEQAFVNFRLETLINNLKKRPGGYDFLFNYRGEKGERYKQITVMWGDLNHRSICLVRADVTDMLAEERKTKKALENALALAEEANRAKSDFLSAMSHDIRTPMNAIMGMTALATAHLGDQERVAEYLKTISVSSKHLLSLINDILDMSKIEYSQIKLNRMKISLSGLLDQMAAIMMPQAKSGKLEFRIRKEGIVHEAFYGDALRISQILINILSNAVKYTPEGGSVEFLTEEIPAVKYKDRVRYRFTVKDTGIGMTEEFIAHIFEPFTRSRNITRVEGTGLGLSITKGLVDLMEGEISVESRLHEGSVFTVELECEPVDAEEVNAGRSEKPGEEDSVNKEVFDGKRFLVAEDNAINAEILCELLAIYGAKADVFTDGVKAVRAFKGAEPGTYDAVLMDIQMPQMNGYEAARAIRSMERADAGNIPIIAMTANAFAEDVRAALEAGMNAHVAKPIDIKVLRETLKEVFA